MTDGPAVIELGDVGAEREPARGAVPSIALVLLIVAAAAGGAAFGAAWGRDRAESERRAADAATVALVVHGGEPALSGGGNPLQAQLTGLITVINAGPLPVRVDTFQGSAPGITLTGIDRERRIAPGVASGLEAIAVIDCEPGITSAPVQVDVRLTTADGVSRLARLPMAMRGTGWAEAAARMCRPR